MLRQADDANLFQICHGYFQRRQGVVVFYDSVGPTVRLREVASLHVPRIIALKHHESARGVVRGMHEVRQPIPKSFLWIVHRPATGEFRPPGHTLSPFIVFTFEELGVDVFHRVAKQHNHVSRMAKGVCERTFAVTPERVADSQEPPRVLKERRPRALRDVDKIERRRLVHAPWHCHVGAVPERPILSREAPRRITQGRARRKNQAEGRNNARHGHRIWSLHPVVARYLVQYAGGRRGRGKVVGMPTWTTLISVYTKLV